MKWEIFLLGDFSRDLFYFGFLGEWQAVFQLYTMMFRGFSWLFFSGVALCRSWETMNCIWSCFNPGLPHVKHIFQPFKLHSWLQMLIFFIIKMKIICNLNIRGQDSIHSFSDATRLLWIGETILKLLIGFRECESLSFTYFYSIATWLSLRDLYEWGTVVNGQASR